MQQVLTGDLDVLLDDQAEATRLRAERPDLTRLTDYELVERARGLLPTVRRLFERHLTVTAGASIGPGILVAIAEAMGDPSIALRLITGVGDVDSALPSRAMWQLSRLDPDSPEFRAGFDAFLVEYGSRGPNEWDIISDVWETKPELALSLINVMRKQGDEGDPAARSAAGAAEREAVTTQVRAALAGDRRHSLNSKWASSPRTPISPDVNEPRRTSSRWSTRSESHSVSLPAATPSLSPSSTCCSTTNSTPSSTARTISTHDCRSVRSSTRRCSTSNRRSSSTGRCRRLSEWPKRGRTGIAVSDSGDVLHGVPGCPGVVTGTARVILDPTDPMALEPGDILIAPFTDPAWTPLFVPAAGVVVNVGAQVSHAIIVSRELGIPCVVSVIGATESIPDGATVTVDGGAGTVTVL